MVERFRHPAKLSEAQDTQEPDKSQRHGIDTKEWEDGDPKCEEVNQGWR